MFDDRKFRVQEGSGGRWVFIPDPESDEDDRVYKAPKWNVVTAILPSSKGLHERDVYAKDGLRTSHDETLHRLASLQEHSFWLGRA